MTDAENARCKEIERQALLLRERERSLRCLAQSSPCRARADAQAELDKVRDALADAYAQMRRLGPN